MIDYDRMFADDNSGPDALPRGFERWTIDPAAGQVERRMLDPAPQELPVFDAPGGGIHDSSKFLPGTGRNCIGA